MDRRVMLVGATAAVVGGSLAWADDGTGSLPDVERRFAERLGALGTTSLATARLARRRGDDDDVKEFVQFEIGEQEALGDVLRTMRSGVPAANRVKPPSDDELAAALDGSGHQVVDGLAAQKDGLDFDQAFIRLQTELHRHMADATNDYLRSGHLPAMLSVAKLANATIAEHLTILGDIDAALGRG